MIKNVCELKECPDCASSNIICDNAKEQLICRDCGLIFQPLAPAAEEKFERTHGLVTKKKKKAKKTKKTKKKKAKAKKKAKKKKAKRAVKKKRKR